MGRPASKQRLCTQCLKSRHPYELSQADVCWECHGEAWRSQARAMAQPLVGKSVAELERECAQRLEACRASQVQLLSALEAFAHASRPAFQHLPEDGHVWHAMRCAWARAEALLERARGVLL